ncbi:MAG: DUF3048 domain-containing protein [Actinomycetota bacterium]
MSRRGKAVAAAATASLVVGALGYFVLFPEQAPAFVRRAMSTVGLTDGVGLREDAPTPPTTCPLTGEVVDAVPARPALAVKVENYPDARPQAGLASADIVYEEPVEGGITRFIALFQCAGVDRVGPVRSARVADPDVLAQYGVPVLAYSGGAPNVVRVVAEADLVPLDETTGAAAFTRDPNRPAPHNLYVDTSSLYRIAQAGHRTPAAVFRYRAVLEGRARRVSTIHLPFSPNYADVFWTWSRRLDAWVRSHGGEPHVDESGQPVSAENVVVQMVSVVVGPRGGITPHLELTGSGRAYVFRDGRMIVGRWERASLRDVTRFSTKDGAEIALAPGRTWVELFPDDLPVGTD